MSSNRTLSQRFLFFSQACDTFVFETFKTLGKKIHDHPRRMVYIPMLLMLPLM